MKPKLTEAIYDMLWACVTLIVVAIQSIPLALAILVALALCILPEAIGWHQSWVRIISEVNGAGAPHGLFFITKQLFVLSWIFAFFTKLLVLPDEQNMMMHQCRMREKRRHILRDEAFAPVKSAVEKLEKPLADPVSGTTNNADEPC